MDLITILLVTGGAAVGAALGAALRNAGFGLHVVHDAEAAAAAFRPGEHALVLIEADAGEGAGAICRAVRDVSSDVPIVVVGENHSEADAVAALEAGADDYVARCSSTASGRRTRDRARRSTPTSGVSG